MNPSRSRIKVMAVGNYACSNVGDELLLATLKQWVESEGAELTPITLNPDHTRALHGLNAVSYFDLPAIASKAREADVMVLGGGGIFTDRFAFSIPQLYSYPAFTLAQFASVCYLAKQFDLQLVLWGQGVGPLKTSDAKQIVADLFGVADHVSVRDPGSADLLQRLGVEREVLVAPDPVWALNLPEVSIDLRERFPQFQGRKILVLNPLVFERSAEVSDRLVAALRQSLDDGWACLWIAFQKNALDFDDYHFRLPDDRPLIERLIAEVGACCPHAIWDDPNVSELLPALRQVDAVVMERFHGAILGIRSRVPIMVIEYDDKVTQAAEMAGIPPSQRVRVDDSPECYSNALNLVMNRVAGQPPWRPDTDTIEALSRAAGRHRGMLSKSIALAALRQRSAWQSKSYDWLSAWCTQIDARRWQAERKLRQMAEELERARAVNEEKARQCERLTLELERTVDLRTPQARHRGSVQHANGGRLFGKMALSLRWLRAKLSKED